MSQVSEAVSSGSAKRVYLATIGDVNSPRTSSGTPYYLLQAAREAGLIDEGLNLDASGWVWKIRRYGWNLGAILRGRRSGGYQFQPAFLERLYAPYRETLKGNSVINCFQLYPPSVVSDASVQKWYYVDMSLLQMFKFYGLDLDKRMMKEVIEREIAGYQAASGVMTLCAWAAQSIVEDYGISPERVHVVLPGANLDQVEYRMWERRATIPASCAGRPLRLVFVGKEWARKGLDTLMSGFRLARESGANVTLRVIGIERDLMPADYRDLASVEYDGFLDKRKEMARFLRCVSECDIGCLLSRAEAAGIAVREYAALGLATFLTDAGGLQEMTDRGATIQVPALVSAGEVAEFLQRLDRDRARVDEMRAVAFNTRSQALWPASLRRMADILEQHSVKANGTTPGDSSQASIQNGLDCGLHSDETQRSAFRSMSGLSTSQRTKLNNTP
jgi:glycosyltransferase involved in cell wall biosynthesis